MNSPERLRIVIESFAILSFVMDDRTMSALMQRAPSSSDCTVIAMRSPVWPTYVSASSGTGM